MSTNIYADIILPLAVNNAFTYRVGPGLKHKIKEGCCVVVPFGNKNRYTGIVYRLHNNKPGITNIKQVRALADPAPLVSAQQLSLWQWVSDYYHCSLGEVMNAALPSVITSFDEKKKFRLKRETKIELPQSFSQEELSSILDRLQKTPARYRLMITYLGMISPSTTTGNNSVTKKELLKRSGKSPAILNKLIEEGLLKERSEEVSRFHETGTARQEINELSVPQREACDHIISEFSEKGTVLLHGVTSSGKTEIYIHLINQALIKGEKVLYLLPEIALTTQIINRLRSNFGDLVGVYHSGLSENEKAEVYSRICGRSSLGEYKVLLGVRSSVFLPIDRLGLVIIDEEHDSSYKQFDPAPRYNARDTAIMYAHLNNARVLLGSATPSVESMYNAENGKYGYAFLSSRYGDINMPGIILADFKEAYRKKMMISHFTPVLIDAIDRALNQGEQIVLFRNRRGFAHFIICGKCGWTPVCPNCSVNFTYHKNLEQLYCHYCGSTESLPAGCASCSSADIKMKGFGTEKVEDEISILFPDAKIDRMDYDSTRRKGSVEKLITDLEKGKTDILIGTQMISKGLDIENLTVVGILNIDGMLFYPDFRAYERCFQLASQVSGRAGRRKTLGRVIIQTADPAHPVMKQIINNDYRGMYETQLAERKEFNYPPFSRLVRIYIKHKEQDVVNKAANIMAVNLRDKLGSIVLGPDYPPHSRIQNLYIKSILLKTDKSKSYHYIRELIKRNSQVLRNKTEFSGLRIYSDVDPQ